MCYWDGDFPQLFHAGLKASLLGSSGEVTEFSAVRAVLTPGRISSAHLLFQPLQPRPRQGSVGVLAPLLGTGLPARGAQQEGLYPSTPRHGLDWLPEVLLRGSGVALHWWISAGSCCLRLGCLLGQWSSPRLEPVLPSTL